MKKSNEEKEKDNVKKECKKEISKTKIKGKNKTREERDFGKEKERNK
jgi:hypothetical protein